MIDVTNTIARLPRPPYYNSPPVGFHAVVEHSDRGPRGIVSVMLRRLSRKRRIWRLPDGVAVRSRNRLEAILKTIAAIVLLSCCELAQDKRAISRAEIGCGPQDVKYEVKTDESQHPTPAPEQGKALIYFVADGHLTTSFGFDEQWVGAIDGGGYFFVPIDPGEHHVCAMLQSF